MWGGILGHIPANPYVSYVYVGRHTWAHTSKPPDRPQPAPRYSLVTVGECFERLRVVAGKGTLHFGSPRGRGCEASHASLLGGANGGHVRAPGGHNLRLLIRRHLEDLARKLRGGPDAAILHHAHHLVAHNLAPVRPVLVGVHDSDLFSLHVVHYNRLLAQHPSAQSAISPFHARQVLARLDEAVLHLAGVDDGDALADELVRADDQAEGGQGARVVLDEHAVEHAHGPAAGHSPPFNTVLGHLLVHVQEAVLAVGNVARVGRVEGIAGARLVHLEIFVVALRLVLVRVHTNLVVAVGVFDGGIDADG